MKYIYFDPTGKIHSMHNYLFTDPPQGYSFVLGDSFWDTNLSQVSKQNVQYKNYFSRTNKLFPINFSKSFLEYFKKIRSEAILTYCNGHINFRNEPWVLDFESIIQITGYNIYHLNTFKKLIRKYLLSNNCKKIIPWTEKSKMSMSDFFTDEKIINKVKVVPLGIKDIKKIDRRKNRDTIKILLLGTINIPRGFVMRGGVEVLKAFEKISQRYDNVELIIRSDIPNNVRITNKKIKVIDYFLSKEELDRLFYDVDILLYPCYGTPGLAFLEAMNFQLPIITSNVWANNEMVSHNYNGFLIDDPIYENLVVGNTQHWPAPYSVKFFKNTDNIVRMIIKYLTILIEDEEKRLKMGENGKKIFRQKYTLEKRNAALKNIFDEITGATS
jgi:glycosyltransferase involved in cell wall biosynthesis